MIAQAAASAEAFDVSPVLARYQAEQGADDVSTRRLWRELARFLVMVGHAGKRGYGMHGPADELWHHFVLHTELYQAFCEQHAGRFLHHHPGSTQRGSVWRAGYLRFLVDYRAVFGEAPPDDIWPLPTVSSVKLPQSTAELRRRHVKAMALFEGGGTLGAGVGVSPLDGSIGCGAVGGGGRVDAGDGGDGGGDGGGCGGGCSG
jgi:hypothetical protein